MQEQTQNLNKHDNLSFMEVIEVVSLIPLYFSFFLFLARQREFVATGTRMSEGQYVYGFTYKANQNSSYLCIGTECKCYIEVQTPGSVLW